MIEVLRYVTVEGRIPFEEWHAALRDKRAYARILLRLDRLTAGNFGDCKPVGEGVLELRDNFGPGYRLYCARDGQTVVVLLMGGDKSTQPRDITKAKGYWHDYKRRTYDK